MKNDPFDALVPELEEAQGSLEGALKEACATTPASKAGTDELIRVEELLEAAGDAAKRAISLRRKRRANKAANGNGPVAMGDVEAEASADATHRAFVDARGVQWDVFAVYPETRESAHSKLKGTYSKGWLCFDSGAEKRRLSPIPDQWQGLGDAQLAQLSERAEVASSRRGRPRRPSHPETGGPADVKVEE